MSPSELSAASAESLFEEVRHVLALVDSAVASGSTAGLEPAVVQQLVTAAVRLHYSRAGDLPGFVPGQDVISTSEALTLAAALLREHDISTFDFALWLSRTGQM